MALKPGLAHRIRRIGQEEDPAVDGEQDRNESEDGPPVLVRAEQALRNSGVGHRPQAHVDEKSTVRRGGPVLDENDDADQQHDRRDEEVAAKVADQIHPGERPNRQRQAEMPPVAFDLVADRRSGALDARRQRDRRGAVYGDDAVAEPEAASDGV